MKKTEWFIIGLCVFAVLIATFYTLTPLPSEPPPPVSVETYTGDLPPVDVDGEACISNSLDGLATCLQRKNLVYLIRLGWSPPGYCE